jgi:hypothetical protein
MLIEDLGRGGSRAHSGLERSRSALHSRVRPSGHRRGNRALFEEAGATLEPVSAGGVTRRLLLRIESRVLTDGRIRVRSPGKVLVSTRRQAVVECILENGAPSPVGKRRGAWLEDHQLQSMAMRKFGKQLILTPMDSMPSDDLLRDRRNSMASGSKETVRAMRAPRRRHYRFPYDRSSSMHRALAWHLA